MLVPAMKIPFDPAAHAGESTRLAFGKAALDLGERNPDIVLLTADSIAAVEAKEFFQRFPDRAFDVGIAEQNLIGMAAGMASCGLVPMIGGFGPFIVFRALEQLRNDAAYTKLHMVMGGTYTGISMATGGSTHHTTEDFAILRSIANMTVLAPADAREAYKATVAACQHSGPVFIRLGGRTPEPVLYAEDYEFKIGKAVQLREGDNATIIATGSLVFQAVLAADMLRQQGLNLRVLNMHTIKPLDEEAVVNAARETRLLITVEEHNVLGGLGGAVAEVVTSRLPVRVVRIGIKDKFASIGPLADLQKKEGLTYEYIAAAAKQALAR